MAKALDKRAEDNMGKGCNPFLATDKLWSAFCYIKMLLSVYCNNELISALRADINLIRGLRPLIIPWFGWPTANKLHTGRGRTQGQGQTPGGS